MVGMNIQEVHQVVAMTKEGEKDTLWLIVSVYVLLLNPRGLCLGWYSYFGNIILAV